MKCNLYRYTEGRVKTRTAPNDKIPTGMVEIAADKVTILNTVAKSLPFSISGAGVDDGELREEVRLKNRVLVGWLYKLNSMPDLSGLYLGQRQQTASHS